MYSKIFGFNKVERTNKIIEERVNNFLKDNTLKLASISESSTKGKLYLTLFAEQSEGKGATKVKFLKDKDPERVQKSINEFLVGKTLKFSTQCSSTSNLTVLIFYTEISQSGQNQSNNKDQSGQNQSSSNKEK